MSIVFAAVVPHPPIIVPEIGKGEEKKIEKTTQAYEKLSRELAAAKPDTIIFITPHTLLYPDMFNVCGMEKLKGNFHDFGFPEYHFVVENNISLANEIVDQSETEGIASLLYDNDADYYLDHGVMVPLYFFNKYLKKNVGILPIGYTYGSRAEHYMFGQILSEVCGRRNERIAVIASGDLSHHLLEPEIDGENIGLQFDKKIIKLIKDNDEKGIIKLDQALIERAGECGYKSILVLLGAVSDLAYESEVYSYEGPFGVGYLVANLQIDKQLEL